MLQPAANGVKCGPVKHDSEKRKRVLCCVVVIENLVKESALLMVKVFGEAHVCSYTSSADVWNRLPCRQK
jgi:hypothetical protein